MEILDFSSLGVRKTPNNVTHNKSASVDNLQKGNKKTEFPP